MGVPRLVHDPEQKAVAREQRREPTSSEARLWTVLRASGLEVRFRRQAWVLGQLVSFWCPARKLVIWLDAAAPDPEWLDMATRAYGITVLQVEPKLVVDSLRLVVSRIAESIRRIEARNP